MNSTWIEHGESLAPALGCAMRAAARGGDVLQSYWQRLTGRQIQEKGKGDLVTAADLEAEAAITSTLRASCPGDRIVSEEGTTQAGSGITWYVDPLDGTTNFVQRFPVFAVSIGGVKLLNDECELHYGVVWNPVSNECFYAARGRGSFRNGEKLRCPDKRELRDAMIATGFPRRYHDELPQYLKEFAAVFPRCRAIRRAGAAALDLCWSAQGIFDGFWEHRLAPWDIAAGALILEEAGGICTDFEGTRTFLTTGHILGAAHGIHSELLSVVQAARA